MNYYLEKSVDRNNLSSVKNDKNIIKHMLNQEYYDDTISMWISEMDFPVSLEITKALQERISREVIGYTSANEKYYESIIGWYKNRHNVEVKKRWIMYNPGVINALRNTIRVFTSLNSGVIVQPPVFSDFAQTIKTTGRKIIKNELIYNDGKYAIDFDDLRIKAEDEKNTLLVLCNPHNPIGEVWNKTDLKKIVDICNENGVMIFSDEVHSDILREDVDFHPLFSIEGSENSIVGTSLSKTFNLTGLKLTNLIIRNNKIRKALDDYTGHSSLSPFVLVATITALNKAEKWLNNVNKVIDSNFEFMKKYIDDFIPSLSFEIPKSTYLVWLKISKTGLSENEFLDEISRKGKLVLQKGSVFGPGGEGYLRMSIATPRHILVDALQRLEEVVNNTHL